MFAEKCIIPFGKRKQINCKYHKIEQERENVMKKSSKTGNRGKMTIIILHIYMHLLYQKILGQIDRDQSRTPQHTK